VRSWAEPVANNHHHGLQQHNQARHRPPSQAGLLLARHALPAVQDQEQAKVHPLAYRASPPQPYSSPTPTPRARRDHLDLQDRGPSNQHRVWEVPKENPVTRFNQAIVYIKCHHSTKEEAVLPRTTSKPRAMVGRAPQAQRSGRRHLEAMQEVNRRQLQANRKVAVGCKEVLVDC